MRLIYSEPAISDLVNLRKFIAQKNPSAAARVAAELVRRINLLTEFPDIGRPVDLASDPSQIRDSIFGDYVVRYAKTSETIAILRIWHHAQDREPHT